MDEGPARNYIEGAAGQQPVSLQVDLPILDRSPQSTRAGGRITVSNFGGEIAKITVVKLLSSDKVDVLFDDGSMPEAAPAKPTPEPVAPKPPVSAEALKRQDAIAAFLGVSADTCGWRLTPEQGETVRRFIAETKKDSILRTG